jgi:hypothetical protein
MQTTLELLEKAPESLIAAGVSSAFVPRNRAAIAADRGCGSVTRVLEPAPEPAVDPRCLWCDRTFTTRATGGSAQKFCCTGHRHQFGSRRVAGRCGRSRWAYTLGRLLEGVSRERARCLRGILVVEIPPMAEQHSDGGSEGEISPEAGHRQEGRSNEGSTTLSSRK